MSDGLKGWQRAIETLAAPPAQPAAHADYPCRTDGRCQYAIESGAEGMGHCPKGKCVMAQPAEPAQRLTDERAAFEAWIRKDGGDLSTFGHAPDMHYRNSAVNNAWTGWQARAIAAAIVPQWRPIESAPSDTPVLLYTPKLHEANPERIEAREYHNSRAGSRHAWATHWMPLPSAPKATK